MKKPMFTTRHYKVIAEVLHVSKKKISFDQMNYLVDNFNHVFEYDNPNFDASIFINAIIDGQHR